MKRWAPVVLAAAALAAGPAAAGDVRPWLESLDRADALMASTTGYTAVFHKTERVGDRLIVSGPARLKFMRPFSVYLEWLNPGSRGGEAIYVEGWNRNRVHTHPGGFWGLLTFNLKLSSRWLSRDNRHLITDIGMHHLVSLLDDNVRRAVTAGEFESTSHGPIEIFHRPAFALEGAFPAGTETKYWCRRTVVYFEVATGLPLNIRNLDENGDLVEEYGYEDFRIDHALSATDFDPANPAYRF